MRRPGPTGPRPPSCNATRRPAPASSPSAVRGHGLRGQGRPDAAGRLSESSTGGGHRGGVETGPAGPEPAAPGQHGARAHRPRHWAGGAHGAGAAIDTTTASGKLVFGILTALAELERELISERTTAGPARYQRRRAVQGARRHPPDPLPPRVPDRGAARRRAQAVLAQGRVKCLSLAVVWGPRAVAAASIWSGKAGASTGTPWRSCWSTDQRPKRCNGTCGHTGEVTDPGSQHQRLSRPCHRPSGSNASVTGKPRQRRPGLRRSEAGR